MSTPAGIDFPAAGEEVTVRRKHRHAFFPFTGSVRPSRDVLDQLGETVAAAFND